MSAQTRGKSPRLRFFPETHCGPGSSPRHSWPTRSASTRLVVCWVYRSLPGQARVCDGDRYGHAHAGDLCERVGRAPRGVDADPRGDLRRAPAVAPRRWYRPPHDGIDQLTHQFVCELETSTLYTLAAKLTVEPLSILNVSDSSVTGETWSAEQREQGFSRMAEIASDLARSSADAHVTPCPVGGGHICVRETSTGAA